MDRALRREETDHLDVTDLTEADVHEMKRFLGDTRADVKRWLPEPEWRPGWQSEAAQERADREHGTDGPWGDRPVRAAYTATALYLSRSSSACALWALP